MTPRMVQAAVTSSRNSSIPSVGSSKVGPKVDFNTIGRAPLRLTMNRTVTSQDLEILESTPDLLLTPIPEPDGVAKDVSLLKGFNATIPSSEKGKIRRRKMRNVGFDEDQGEGPGLKKLGFQTRGLLTEGAQDHDEAQGNTGKKRRAKKGRESAMSSKLLGPEELNRQRGEILQDKENLHVRRVCLHLLLGH